MKSKIKTMISWTQQAAETQMAKKRSSSKASVDLEIEWAGTGENPEDWILDEGHYALETNDASLLGKYFREAREVDPDIQAKVADLLDPPSKNRTRLVYVNSQGRPRPARKNQSNIFNLVRFALRRNKGKMEAAVAEVMKITGKSRSTIFAAMKRRSKKA